MALCDLINVCDIIVFSIISEGETILSLQFQLYHPNYPVLLMERAKTALGLYNGVNLLLIPLLIAL